jgi:hypothetical protein
MKIAPAGNRHQQWQGRAPPHARKFLRVGAAGEIANHRRSVFRHIRPLRQQFLVRLDPDPGKQLPALRRDCIAVIAGAATQLADRRPRRSISGTAGGKSSHGHPIPRHSQITAGYKQVAYLDWDSEERQLETRRRFGRAHPGHFFGAKVLKWEVRREHVHEF